MTLIQIVSAKELKLMNHPAIREIIKIKWRKFGQSRCLINLLIYGVYLASWTCVVFIYQPWRLEQMKSGDSTTDGANIASVCVAVILFLYLVSLCLTLEYNTFFTNQISNSGILLVLQPHEAICCNL